MDPKMTWRDFYSYIFHDRVLLRRLVTLISMTGLAVVAVLSSLVDHWVLAITCFLGMVVICMANYNA